MQLIYLKKIELEKKLQKGNIKQKAISLQR